MTGFRFLVLLLAGSGPQSLYSQQLLQDFKLIAPYTSREMIIDGHLSEWKGLKKHQIAFSDRELNQGGIDRILSDNKVTLNACWDLNFLYLAFRVQDRDIRAVQTAKDHPQLYLDDMVEFLLDPGNDRTNEWLSDDIVYHINAAGTKKDDRGSDEGISDAAWDGKGIYAVRLMGSLNDTTDTDEGYHVEVAIPWGELGISPGNGKTIGFNAANGDCDGKGRQIFDWAGAWPLRSPNQFGSLILTGRRTR